MLYINIANNCFIEMNCNNEMALLMVGIIIFTSVITVLTPMLVIFYESEFFLAFITSVEFVIIYFVLYIFFVKTRTISSFNKNEKLLVLQSSVFNAYTTIAMVYSSHPSKTPPIMQSTLMGLSVIPSAIFRKYYSNINPNYNTKYIIISCMLLLVSVILSVIPMTTTGSTSSIGWSLLYFSSICTKCYYSVIQEKFIKETETINFTQTQKLENRISMSFCSRILMTIIIIPFFSCEWIDHTGNQPFISFKNDFIDAFSNISKGLLLQGFIICYFCVFFMSLYVNAVSTNYNMILSATSVPSIALFYTFVPGMTYDVNYPIWTIILSITSIIASIYFWIKGDEQKNEYDDYKMLQGENF